MFDGVSTMSGSRKVTSGRPPSGPIEDCSNHWLCFFGLTNSPATFQTMMNDMFTDMISEGVVVVYLDDILIFTEDLEEHH